MFDVRGRMLYKRSMTTTQTTKKLSETQARALIALARHSGYKPHSWTEKRWELTEAGRAAADRIA